MSAFKELIVSGIEKAGLKAVDPEEYKAFEAYKASLNETNLVSANTADGNVISQEQESWTEGEPIFFQGDGELLPLPEGEYTLEDGTKLIVNAESVLESITPAESEEEEEEMSDQNYVTKEELEAYKVDLIEEVTNAVAELLKSDFSEEKKEEEKPEEKEEKKELAATTVKKEKKETTEVDTTKLTAWQRVLHNKNKSK